MIPHNIKSEFELTADQVVQQVLNDQGDAIIFYAMAFQRMANDRRLHPEIRNYARRTIKGANSILGNV